MKVENYCNSKEDLALLGSNQASELILLSAKDCQELKKRVQDLLPIAERICRAELIDLAAALAQEPQTGNLRLAIVAKSPWHLAELLQRFKEYCSQTGRCRPLPDKVVADQLCQVLDADQRAIRTLRGTRRRVVICLCWKSERRDHGA